MSNPILAELQSVRRDLAALSVRVLALEEGLAEGSLASNPFSSPVTVNYVSGTGSPYPEVPPFPNLDRNLQTPETESASTPLRRSSPGAEPTEAERRAAAISIGGFLRRSIAGDHRGESGRSRIALPSTIYVLIRDLQGRHHDPVRIFYSFSAIRPFVKEGSSCGNSIFCGFPSTWEAQLGVRTAGLLWPGDGGSA